MRVSTFALAVVLLGCGETRPVKPAAAPSPASKPSRSALALLVEGLPRFDTRGLRNLLYDSPTFNYQILFVTPPDLARGGLPTQVHGEAGPGLKPLTGFPSTAADLARFDVIILGDLDPIAIGGHQGAARLVEYVRGGGGLLVICGRNHTPSDYLPTDLREVLPFDQSLGYEEHGAMLELTEAGKAHELTRLSPDTKLNEETWKEIGGRAGFVRVRGVAAADVVLAEARFAPDPARAPDKKVTEPVLVAHSAGRGRVVVFLTDNLHALKNLATNRKYQDDLHTRALMWARRKK
ncbi:MAG TPA: hypothetical protein VI643_06455 [Planctomycetota bacterium]|nr:hypothetical protein [Planctomycetota bacterium]